MDVLWNRLRYVLSPQFDIYEQLAQLARGRVADIGSGTGFGTHLLAIGADEACGFEVDDNAIRFARRSFPLPNLRFLTGNIVAGIGGTFDFVTMVDVIEHLADDRGAIANAKAMLAPGGMFACSTPNRLSRYRKAETHVREYSPDELEAVLRGAFEYVNIRNYRLEPLSSPFENPIIGICHQ